MLLGHSVGLEGSYYRPTTKKLPISDEEIEYILERRKLTDKVRRKHDKAIIKGMTYDEYRKGKHHDIVL